MDPITLICVGLIVLLVILFIFQRGKNAPAGTYDNKNVESGGSFGGAGAQRTTDSERVQSGGSFGGTGAQSTVDSPAVRAGGSFGGGQRVEDPVERHPGVAGPTHSAGKAEGSIPKGPRHSTGRDAGHAVGGTTESPFPILRERGATGGSGRQSLNERLHDIEEPRSGGMSSQLGSRASATRSDDDDNDGDSPRVRSSGSFGG